MHRDHLQSATDFCKSSISNFGPIQDTLNTRANKRGTDNWCKNRENWSRAIIHEAVEMQNHIGWAWWKDIYRVSEINRAFMEIVDIYHFWISALLQNRFDATAEGLTWAEFNDAYTSEPTYGKIRATIDDIREKNVGEKDTINALIDLLVLTAARNYVASSLSRQYFNLLDAGLIMQELVIVCGKTPDDLTAWYAGKSALNLFRWDNGYHAKTYIKIWQEGTPITDAKEDNDFLETVILNPEIPPTTESIYNALADEYTGVSGNETVTRWTDSESNRIVAEKRAESVAED